MEEKKYTLEEIQEMLQQQGLDIKSLAQTAKRLKNGEIQEIHKNNKNYQNVTTWELVLEKYPDFVIERKTAKTSKKLVIMASQKSYYISSDKGDQLETLNKSNYCSFTSGMGTIKLKDDFWIDRIEAGKKFFTKFNVVLQNETYMEMVKYKCAPNFQHLRWSWDRAEINDERLVNYTQYPTIYRKYHDDPEVGNIIKFNNYFIMDLITHFGLKNTEDFLTSWKLSLFKKAGKYYNTKTDIFPARSHYLRLINNDEHISSCRPRANMKYSAFKSYVLYESVKMGYGYNARAFWDDWDDALDMQMKLYGKIKDKYPTDLPQLHNQLSYKCLLNEEIIDKTMFDAQSKLTRKYEMIIGDYIFIAPRQKEDFYDEATQQANCLAGYVKKYTEGGDHIMFMRKKDTPETSLVTIEITEGIIRQKYQARNQACTKAQNDVIEQWMEKVRKIDTNQIKDETLEKMNLQVDEIVSARKNQEVTND